MTEDDFGSLPALPDPTPDPTPPEPTPPALDNSKLELLLADALDQIALLTRRLNGFQNEVVPELTRRLDVLDFNVNTTHKDVNQLRSDFEGRFGSQYNCPHCHRKLDVNARRKLHCPICGGRLTPV